MKLLYKSILFFWLAIPLSLFGQNSRSQYDLKVKLDQNKKTLEVQQKIYFQNNTNTKLKEFYFNDWSNAYSSSKSPLAQRFAEEYDRRFYLDSKSKRGQTTDLKIEINNKEIHWNRLAEQVDIIQVSLDDKLDINEEIKISLSYTVELPDARYTGYGIVSEDEYFLKNCFIQISPYIDGKWITNSNLDLEEVSLLPSDFSIEWNIPEGLHVNSNLSHNQEFKDSNQIKLLQKTDRIKEIQFHIGKEKYREFLINGLTIQTDLKEVTDDLLDPKPSLLKIESFVSGYLGKFPHQKMLLSQMDYKKRPYFGLSGIPSILEPFSDRFEFEIKALSIFLAHYLNEQFLVDPRENFWLTGGLHSLLLMEYVDRYYPNQKLLGKIPSYAILKPFLKHYTLSDVSFNHSFLYFGEYTIRNNIQQSPLTSKSELIKFNERVALPSKVAHAIRYAFKYHGKEKISQVIKTQIGKVKSKDQLITAFQNQLDIPWLFEGYLNTRNSIDLKFKKIRRENDSLKFIVKQKQKHLIPFTIGQLKNDTIIQIHEVLNPKKETEIQVKRVNGDFIVINPSTKIPEFNQQNNYRRLKGTTFKPLKFTFVKDLEDAKRSQIFFNPKTDFNAYDGFVIGSTFSNKALQAKPFSYTLNPNYSTRLNELVGSFGMSYRILNEDSSLFFYQFGFSGSSFHYDENLRYSIFKPSINILKRPDDFRSNQRDLYTISLVSVNREFGDTPILIPNYTVGNLRYVYSNKESTRFLRISGSLEVSNHFGKFNLTSEFRHLFHDGRTLSVRLFAGKFLWNNTQNNTYFDYSLNRSSDYLFQYNYLGRSENEGFYSQQFILTEGGFKSRFNNPNANDYLLATNLGYSLWKWIEVYTDLGITKNRGSNFRAFYDSGLRINLVPDYLEFYFPIQNSENFVLNDSNYISNMRFVLSIDIANLRQLFTRRWL